MSFCLDPTRPEWRRVETLPTPSSRPRKQCGQSYLPAILSRATARLSITQYASCDLERQLRLVLWQLHDRKARDCRLLSTRNFALQRCLLFFWWQVRAGPRWLIPYKTARQESDDQEKYPTSPKFPLPLLLESVLTDRCETAKSN